MNLIKRLLLLLLSGAYKNKKAKNENNLMQEIIQFADNVKKEYGLEDVVEVKFDERFQINKGFTNTNVEPHIIIIGVQECSKLKDLSESQWITIKNTIIHEFQHIKNKVELKSDTFNKLLENKYSLVHYAFLLIDEYNAYKTADGRYKVYNIDSEENKLQVAFKQLWAEKDLFERFGYSKNKQFDHNYDIFTAIIVHGIRNEKFPSIPETDQGYNDMCKKVKEIAIKYNSLMPLNFNDYEEVGQELWNALLLAVPQNLINDFKKNLGI